MPPAKKYFKNDPNKLGRGSGIYYRRGTKYKGKCYKKQGGYFSKYEVKKNELS